jgi:hypothetical protein
MGLRQRVGRGRCADRPVVARSVSQRGISMGEDNAGLLPPHPGCEQAKAGRCRSRRRCSCRRAVEPSRLPGPARRQPPRPGQTGGRPAGSAPGSWSDGLPPSSSMARPYAVEATVIGATARAAARRGSQDDHHAGRPPRSGRPRPGHRRTAPQGAGRRRDKPGRHLLPGPAAEGGHAGHHRDRADATGPVHVQHGVVGRVAHIPAVDAVADHVVGSAGQLRPSGLAACW